MERSPSGAANISEAGPEIPAFCGTQMFTAMKE